MPCVTPLKPRSHMASSPSSRRQSCSKTADVRASAAVSREAATAPGMPRRDLLVGAWMAAAAVAACPVGGAHAAAGTLTLDQVTPRIGPPAALTPRSA